MVAEENNPSENQAPDEAPNDAPTKAKRSVARTLALLREKLRPWGRRVAQGAALGRHFFSLCHLLFKALAAPTRAWQHAWRGLGVFACLILLTPLVLSPPRQHFKLSLSAPETVETQNQETLAVPAADDDIATIQASPPATTSETPPQATSTNNKVGFALVLTELGQQQAVFDQAVQEFPAQVAFSFLPYGEHLQQKIETSKAKGHEILLTLPLEPIAYPTQDPGPGALLTGLAPEENTKRLDAFLKAVPQASGVTLYMGSRFIFSEPDLRALVNDLEKRKLTLLDTSVSPRSLLRKAKLKWPKNVVGKTFSLDNLETREKIENRLRELEDRLMRDHPVIVFAPADPIMVIVLGEWLKRVTEKGYPLRPLQDMIALVQP
ncbi:MAG: divergent polysaccharide deacetylase family protein [Holosporales bacterium]